MKVCRIVGDSSIWYNLESKFCVCHSCSGDGNFSTTDRSCSYPEKYPEELIKCFSCEGSGISRETLRQTS